MMMIMMIGIDVVPGAIDLARSPKSMTKNKKQLGIFKQNSLTKISCGENILTNLFFQTRILAYVIQSVSLLRDFKSLLRI